MVSISIYSVLPGKDIHILHMCNIHIYRGAKENLDKCDLCNAAFGYDDDRPRCQCTTRVGICSKIRNPRNIQKLVTPPRLDTTFRYEYLVPPAVTLVLASGHKAG